jgi:hypothetical protein
MRAIRPAHNVYAPTHGYTAEWRWSGTVRGCFELDAQQLAAVCGESCPTTRLNGDSIQRVKGTNQEEIHIGVIGRKMDDV